jgi:general secretion pathway protein F
MMFALRVLSQGAAPSDIKLDANTAADARAQAEQLGFAVLNIRSERSFFSRTQFNQKLFPLQLFCQEFRVLFEAGLSAIEVLQTLIDKENIANNKQVLQQLLAQIQQGKTLSTAMRSQPAAFPSLFTATIAAAETTGDLPEALHRYSQYLENVDLLKKRIVSASVYPAIVVSFGLIVLMFLLIYVVPKFSKIYETQIHNVSTSTQFLLKIGQFSQQYAWLILLLGGALIVTIIMLLSRADVRAKLVDALWKLPFLGKKLRIYHLSRFYRTFAMLLKSGIPVVNGLNMVDSLLGAGLQNNLQLAKKRISEGQHFSDALHSADLTTPVALRLFNVGEKTGTLDTMMERAASFHEEEMMRVLDRFTKIFEPTLMALIGLLIGGIVLMMYLPIFELASGIQ